LGFFAEVGWIDSGLVPFVLLDEFGRLADDVLGWQGVEQMRGYQDALFYAGVRAVYVGDVERLQQVVRSGDTVESPSAGLLQMRQAEALFRGDFVAAVSFGEAAVEAARQADDRACRANMLALLYMP